MQRLTPLLGILAVSGMTLVAATPAATAQDQIVFYFPGAVAQTGTLGGVTFDASGNFWVIGREDGGGISKLSNNGSAWTRERFSPSFDMDLYYRSTNPAAGVTNPTAGAANFAGTPASFLLNPQPLTITVPTGAGGTQTITYQPGELAFISDAMGLLSVNGVDRFDWTKRLTRYDLRKIDSVTAAIPDFDNAGNGSTVFGEFGIVDWNDTFTQVISRQDLRTASGGAGSDNFGRSFAWSSDGQSIYATDAGTSTGGIYKIDASKTGVVTRIWADTISPRNISEPAVVPTSVRDFAPLNPGVGDQIIVMGTGSGGNIGGVNAYLDTGAPGQMAPPSVVFTRAQYASFADYYSETEPQYTSITADSAGNLYFYETATDGIFRYDTQGRFVKVLSEREHNLFQNSQVGRVNDNALDLQVRTSMGPGFQVNELIFTDDALEAPLGVYVYKPGDFDRDNDVDSIDLGMFAGAIGLRNVPADDAFVKFDLNGNEAAYRTIDTLGNPVIRHTNGEQVIVDWKDVKILQQFVEFPNGDTNFDMTLDFADLDTMAANYYTVPGQSAETWIDGDFASIDPEYLFDAPDANLVNEVDLAVIAEAWVVDLGMAAPTSSQLSSRYSGQFLTDAIAAFATAGQPVVGDYDGDGDVDQDDYTVWRLQYGQAGVGLAADGSGDGVVNAADYTVWRDAFSSSSAALAVPEPASVAMLPAVALVATVARRQRGGRR